MKNTVYLLVTWFFVSACSLVQTTEPTQKLTWIPAVEKNHEQMYRDSERCLSQAQAISFDKYGDKKQNFYLHCMQSQGHALKSL